MDYDKLASDLNAANVAAKLAADKTDDGGSANLDSAFLRLPRARESKVLEAIRTAGLYCREKCRWIGEGYMITPTVSGQGNKRTTAVEAFKRHMESCGWDVLIYYQVD